MHRAYRTMLIHELVQSLLDLNNDQIVDPRLAHLQKARLKGKHSSSSRHPVRKCCTVCAYVLYCLRLHAQ